MSKKTPQPPQLNVDLKNTEALSSEDGNLVFQEGFILRKISKFVTGTEEDGVMPIPVFYDVQTGKILIETLPKEIRSEYEENVPV